MCGVLEHDRRADGVIWRAYVRREIENQESAYMSKLKQPASTVVVVKVRVFRNAGELIAIGCPRYPETTSRRLTLICEKDRH